MIMRCDDLSIMIMISDQSVMMIMISADDMRNIINYNDHDMWWYDDDDHWSDSDGKMISDLCWYEYDDQWHCEWWYEYHDQHLCCSPLLECRPAQEVSVSLQLAGEHQPSLQWSVVHPHLSINNQTSQTSFSVDAICAFKPSLCLQWPIYVA